MALEQNERVRCARGEKLTAQEIVRARDEDECDCAPVATVESECPRDSSAGLEYYCMRTKYSYTGHSECLCLSRRTRDIVLLPAARRCWSGSGDAEA